LKSDEGFAKKTSQQQNLPTNHLHRKLWLLFEHPESSQAARVVAITSVLVIIISIVIFCLETLPQYKHYRVIVSGPNETRIVEDDVPSVSNPFFIVESFCIVWFCLEFMIRMIACPSKLDFFRDLMNAIDFMAILPYFITLATVFAQKEPPPFVGPPFAAALSAKHAPPSVSHAYPPGLAVGSLKESKQASQGASLAILRVIRYVFRQTICKRGF
jgi:hypothetical protein